MTRTQIVPGLAVDEEMYEAAATALAAHDPALASLTWQQFVQPRRWWLVPDESGTAYKAELVLREAAATTTKINIWLRPDRRSDGRPRPHSHP
ncbi:hypothetical protein ABZ896_42715 [Streptomyces sp. NPDC047072]|uniref:hypothetical protein n=1 Tax=Streptomyces sp. NPDC047072 TaxID=3154809 RepID=UPI003408C43C